MEPVPLSFEDRAILALESDTVAGHTCKVVRAGAGAPAAAPLAAAIAARIGGAPQLTWRLGGSPEQPAWEVDPDFDVTRHVSDVEVAAPLDRDGLRRLVADLFEQRLARDRPLWQLQTVPMTGGDRAYVWRIHHALADGTAAMHHARALLWDAGAAAAEPGSPAAAAAVARQAELAPADHEAARRVAGRVVLREFARTRRRSPFDGRIGRRREIAFASVPLDALHDAAKALAGATLNDAVLAIVGGALRHWLERHHGPLGTVRVRVPVSLHGSDDDAGNRDSFFAVGVPLGEADPVARLRAVTSATRERKRAHDAEQMDALLQELARVSPRLERFAARLAGNPRTFAVSVSNVPGPRRPVRVHGAPVLAIHSIAEIGERHALRVAVVSVANALCFGFCADPAIVDDVGAMAEGVEAEAAALVAAASA